MKYLILFLIVMLCEFSSAKERLIDFEYKINYIVDEFKNEILNEEKCKSLESDTEDLVLEIENTLKNEDDYSTVEIIRLKKICTDAKALEEYIGSTYSSNMPSIENFYIANNKVGGIITYISKDKYCVDIITLTIGKLVVYLLQNNNNSTYNVSYKWNALNKTNSGNGNMGLKKQSVRRFFDNREKPNIKKIAVFGINCKAIKEFDTQNTFN